MLCRRTWSSWLIEWGWKAVCRQPSQSMAGAWVCVHNYIEKIIVTADSCTACVYVVTKCVPVGLWWSCAGRAGLSSGDGTEGQQTQQAQTTERWTHPHGGGYSWTGLPAGPGTFHTMPRKDAMSGWKKNRRLMRECISAMGGYSCT